MLDHYNKHRRKGAGHRSKLEAEVEAALAAQGFQPEYEKEKIPYILHRKYTPDFKVGDVYIEVKGWWPAAERTKFLSVILSNPGLNIFVALQRPFTAISKGSKTSYAKWCDKHGIAWCPTPIPPAFIDQWLRGKRVTCRVQTPKDAAVQMQLMTTEVISIASPANDDSNQTERFGLQ